MRVLAIQLTGKHANQWVSRPVAEQATKCTNKPHPFVKNMYCIIFVSEMEPGLRVTCHRVTGSSILAGLGRVTGQCVRPGAWPGFEF